MRGKPSQQVALQRPERHNYLILKCVLMSHSKSSQFTGDVFRAAPTGQRPIDQLVQTNTPIGQMAYIHPMSNTSGETSLILAITPDLWPFIAEQLSLLKEVNKRTGINNLIGWLTQLRVSRLLAVTLRNNMSALYISRLTSKNIDKNYGTKVLCDILLCQYYYWGNF